MKPASESSETRPPGKEGEAQYLTTTGGREEAIAIPMI